MSKININVFVDTESHISEGFVLKADPSGSNVWYCKTTDGSFIDAGLITKIDVPRCSGVKKFTSFTGKGCVLEFFDWLDVNKDNLEYEGFNVSDYQSIG